MSAAAADALEAPEAKSRRARLRGHVFAATWASYAGFYVTRKVFSVLKGPVMRALGTDDLGVSHLWTTYLIAYAAGMFATAALATRVRARTLLLAGMTLSTLANVATAALLPLGDAAYFPLFVVFAAHGFAQSVGWPSNVAIVGRWTHRIERGSVMGAWCTCYQLGSVFAKGLAAFAYTRTGLSGAFVVSSLLLGAVTLAFVRYGYDDPTDHGLAFDDAPPVSDASLAASPEARDDRRPLPVAVVVVSMGVLYFGFKFLRYALDSWAPRLLEDRFGMPVADAGYLSTIFDWVGFLGVLAAGFASDRLFAARRMPLIAAMATAMALACMGLVTVGLTSVATFAVLLGVVGFTAMGPDSLLSAAAAVDTGEARTAARAVAIVNGLGSIGPIVQEPIIGFLKVRFGAGAVFALLAAVATITAVGATSFLAYTRRRGMRL
jgi:OPA family glycerol-3-phosphate transporter-like MFS transporter